VKHREWVPVAPAWERNPDDADIWRRAVTLPGLALNQAERDLMGVVAGRSTYVIGVGAGIAPLALAAMGARVTVVDPSQSMLDVLIVRTQLVGVELAYARCDLSELASLGDGGAQLVYAAQAAPRVEDLGRFYVQVHGLLSAGGRLVVNEYHPFRRIWRPEPGSPRVKFSYFERRRERGDEWPGDAASTDDGFSRFDYQWTIADHFHYLTEAGLRVAAIEEAGEARQQWEMPNLKGLPEQLIVAADRPKADAPRQPDPSEGGNP
jgi:SAM-dependent methyltransferase